MFFGVLTLIWSCCVASDVPPILPLSSSSLHHHHYHHKLFPPSESTSSPIYDHLPSLSTITINSADLYPQPLKTGFHPSYCHQFQYLSATIPPVYTTNYHKFHQSPPLPPPTAATINFPIHFHQFHKPPPFTTSTNHRCKRLPAGSGSATLTLMEMHSFVIILVQVNYNISVTRVLSGLSV